MTTSFYNGVTGLKSFQNGIDIWGDNIANINTIGYKENIPEFSTLFSDLINTSPISSDVGMGSYLSSSAIDLSQGSLLYTDNPFDIAINGEGWFAVKNHENTYYSRTGSFKRDAQGFLVDDSGNYLLVANANNLIKQDDGYKIDTSVKTDNLITSTPNLSPISLPNNVILPAIATTEVKLSTNLNNSDIITTTQSATENIDFSALYSKEGQDLKIRDSDSLVFGFGNPATYDKNLISTQICIKEPQNYPAKYDFTVNGKEISFEITQPSSKEEIAKTLEKYIQETGITCKTIADGIEISDPQQIIIQSNNDLIPDTAVAKLTYKTDPQNEYEFSTIKEFNDILKNLAQKAYPDKADVYIDDEGRISIHNNSLENLNAYALKTEHSNELFMNNLGRLGNEIYPQTDAKSFAFLCNSQQFGGTIIDVNSQKDTLSFNFIKQKVLDNQTLWEGIITVTDPQSDTITTQKTLFTFDANGMLIEPKTVKLTQPQEITLNLNLTAYNKIDSSTVYSYSQDGIEEGYLKSYQIDPSGNIQALFSNGKMSVLGQIPIYHFQNDQGLESIGSNLFRQTENSNKAIIYTDENGNYIPSSTIKSNTLENSNVDFAQAMTELIVTQKAYASAAKTVTTSDQMIQRAINMKR